MAGSASVSWQEKVRRLLGGGRGKALPRGALPKLATRLGLKGEDRRQLHYWIVDERSPRHETAIVARVAQALNVDRDWLLDGKEGEPVSSPVRVSDDVVRAVPPKYRRLAYALTDPETADHLLACLDLYERARRRGRASP